MKKRPPEPPPIGDERTLPHDLVAERAILGAILLHPDAYDAAADVVDGGDFFRDAHKRIFEAMGRLADGRKPVEFVTLREELARVGDLDEVGGPMYLTALPDGVPRSSNIEHYAAIVREKSKLRAAIFTANKLSAQAYEGETRSTELTADAAEKLYAIGGDANEGSAVLLADLIAPSMESLERNVNGGGNVTGVSTGYHKLDDMTAGLHPGDLILIAARTSQGKTALAMNLVQTIAETEEAPPLVFSMEMSKEQLFMRLLSSEARVDSHHLRTGTLTEDDWKRISNALGKMSELKILIDDRGGIGVREVRATARQAKAKHGLSAIFIDYIQLMRGRGHFDNRTQEIGTISRGLKAVGRELGVPVIALSQLSRAAEPMPGRAARAPQLSDLAESGSLENDADVVLLIYRPEAKKDDDEDPLAQVIIAKQRNGPTGVVKLRWNAKYVRFENIGMV